MALVSELKHMCDTFLTGQNDEERISVLVHDKDAVEVYGQGTFKLTIAELKLIRDSCTATPPCKLFRAEVQSTRVLFFVNSSGELVGTGDFNVESRDIKTKSHDHDAGYESCTSQKDDDDDDAGDKDDRQITRLNDRSGNNYSGYKQGRYKGEKREDTKGSHPDKRPSFKSDRKLTLAACSVGKYTVVVCNRGEGDNKGSTLGRVKEVRNVLQSFTE